MSLRHLLSTSSFILAWLGGTAGAAATQPLETFLQHARSYNTGNRESSATRRQRDAEADQALGRLLPAFLARGVYTRNQYEVAAQLPGTSERLVITPQNQLDGLLQLDVPLLDLASYYRYKSSRAVAQSSTEQQAATSLDVDRAVSRAYYQYLGAAALVDSAKKSVAASEANLADVEARASAGAATDLDRQRAIANVERSRQDVADAELALALSARSLQSLSGVVPSAVTSFPEASLEPEAPLASWLGRAGNTPQERAAAKLSQAASYNRKAATAALLPTLSGTAQERFTNATGFSGREASYTLQLMLGWRVDYTTIAGRKVQSAAEDVQLVRQEGVKRNTADQIFEAHRRVEAGIARSRAARAQTAAAARAAELASDRYEAGMVTQLDVTQAQREAFLADATRIQADADLAYSRIVLRLAAGLPITSENPR